MKVPKSLSARREQLAEEIETRERHLQILQASIDEVEGAIRLIEDEADEAEPLAATEPRPLNPMAQAALGAVHVPKSAVSSANTKAAGQRAPKRDIKTLVLNELTTPSTPPPHTVKEIAKAIEAGIQSTEAALKHWQDAGVAAEVAPGKWHSVAGARAVPRQVAAETETDGNGEAAPAAAPATTQDKMIEALTAAGAEGMTDDELAKAGIPYVSVMTAERSGFLQKYGDRYHLNQPTQ